MAFTNSHEKSDFYNAIAHHEVLSFASDNVSIALGHEKYRSQDSDLYAQAQLLNGAPVVAEIRSWCMKHSRSRNGVKSTFAVIYFDTGKDAEEYLYLKAVVAAKAGVDYVAHKLSPEAPITAVLEKIAELNEDDDTHGILIQRPIPAHLCARQLMTSIATEKHIEEYSRGKASNLALGGLTRFLDYHQKSWMLDLDIILLGGTNVITSEFKAELKRRYNHFEQKVRMEQGPNLKDLKHDSIIITELNKGGIIKPNMICPAVKLIIDLGFDPETRKGDLDPKILDLEGLFVAPTPGGVIPVTVWLMMERTIKARDQRERPRGLCGIPGCAII